MNLLEIRNGIVHADCADGNDYTLCGVTAERILNSVAEYTPETSMKETETEPCMVYTNKKIDCETCASIIRYCVNLGTRAIKRGVAK